MFLFYVYLSASATHKYGHNWKLLVFYVSCLMLTWQVKETSSPSSLSDGNELFSLRQCGKLVRSTLLVVANDRITRCGSRPYMGCEVQASPAQPFLHSPCMFECYPF